MRYVYVASNLPSGEVNIGITKSILNQTNLALISLIGGVKQKDFGYHTLNAVSNDIKKYEQDFIRPTGSKLTIDSSGYSVISGAISPDDIDKLIDCYIVYLEDDRDVYDYIFSLDIPIAIKYEYFNTKANIYKYNRRSLEDSKKILLKYPALREKFYFVYHFKMQSQYEIWKQIYKELNLKEVIINRSLGGMVGIRNKCKEKLDFSPFTAMAYKCLWDYEEAKSYDYPFKLHYLGINIDYDRFQILMLEKLFSKYFEDKISIVMTYDSVNYSRTAQMGVKHLEIYNFDGENLERYRDIEKIPTDSKFYDILKHVYYIPEVYKALLMDIKNRQINEVLLNSNIFAPLNIYSNLCLDRFFEYIIEKYELIEVLIQYGWHNKFLSRRNIIFKEMSAKYPYIFTKPFIKSITKNITYLWCFHKWYINNRDYNSLDKMIKIFIKDIGFPDLLK